MDDAMTMVHKRIEATGMNRPARPFVALGSLSAVVGGLVSAVSAASPSYTASWAVAYLVLVAGMGQLALGLAQARLAIKPLPARVIGSEAILYNVANLAILIGTVTESTVLVDAGGVLFVLALALFLYGVRGARPQGRRMLYGFRILIAILLVSTPIGLIIAAVRAG